MKRLAALAILVVAPLAAPAWSQGDGACVDFRRLVRTTYDFKPSKLSEAAQDAKSTAMDKVWDAAKAKPAELAPCLRALLEDANADPWFYFDGANLLVLIDPSPASKALQVRAYTAVDLDDVDLQVWVQTLAVRAEEGLDVSHAGARWLAFPKAKYYLPIHGGFEVKTTQGAMFIYGSMDEAQATPALAAIVNQTTHPGREAALWVLTLQATPESLRVLRSVDATGLSVQVQNSLKNLLKGPNDLIEPAPRPQVRRDEFLRIFDAALRTDWDRVASLRRNMKTDRDWAELTRASKPWDDFIDLLWGGKPTERDAVAVLLPEDLPLLRKLRRRVIVASNQHAIERYNDLTTLIMTIVWNQETKTGRTKP